MLEDKYNISELKQSEAADFIAEVFYDELKFILGEELDILLKLKLHGMNARVHSKDVLNISTDYQAARLGIGSFWSYTSVGTVCTTNCQKHSFILW